nr:EOG090X05OW [Eulimnadia texana]
MLSHCPVIHGVIHIAFIFCLRHCFESADDVHGNVSGIFPLKIMENKDKFHLIESVKKYPAIYNLNSPEYKDNNVKQLYWTKIAKEVGKPAALCKSNWETLRNSYKRCRREEKRNPGRSNASKKKKWQYLDVMSFIDESPLSLPSTVSNGTGHASDDSIVKITEIPQLNETAEVEFATLTACITIGEDGDRNAFQAFEMSSSTDEDDESFKPVSTSAVVAICLGIALLLLSVVAVACLCYRGRQARMRKLRSVARSGAAEAKPLPFRKPTAVRSPNPGAGPFYLKKSPSPTGSKSPPGSVSMKTPSPQQGNTPSTATPTCEASRDFSTANSIRRKSAEATLFPGTVSSGHEYHEPVIRFQLEAEKREVEREKVSPEVEPEPENVTQVEQQDKVDEGSAKLGQLFFKIRHNNEKNILNVTVVKCLGLPARDSNTGSSDPYVKLQLLPDKQHKVKTRVLRRTLNPVYDEDFTFYGISENQLEGLTLHFVILSFDRYSRDDVIGEVLVPVFKALEDSGKSISDYEHLEESDSNPLCQAPLIVRNIAARSLKMKYQGRGELLVSLCYHPQASRLTAVILKARNLPRMDISGLADPYVKTYLVHNGQRISKKKTHVKKRTLNPVFNESFVFDLPPNVDSLDNISLEFLVLDWDRVTKNEVIGRLELGGTKSSGSALHHWKEVLSSPRRQIAEWHKLKE